MKEIMLFFILGLCGGLGLVCLIFGKKIKQSTINQLSEEEKDILRQFRARTISFDDEEVYKKKAWKQLGILALITLATLGLVMGIFAFSGARDIGFFFEICIFFFVLMMLLGVLFVARDGHRVNRGQMIMITKCYVQTIIVGKGKSARIVYYDYIKNEFDTETVSVSTFRKDLRDLKKGDFIEILVKEKKNKLKFIDFR